MDNLDNGLSRFILSRCALCHALQAETPSLCSACLNDMPCIEKSCLICGMPLSISDTCGSCMVLPAVLNTTICAYRYAYPLDLLIKRYKYKQKLDLILPLVTVLSEKILANSEPLPEVIVPVPLHFNRLFKRGFNQSLEISKTLSRIINVPVDNNLIVRVRNTTPQFKLSSKQRKKNLRGAFRLMPGRTYQSVAIVDDIITSGATGDEIAQLFRHAGVRRIQLWALARADE
jgi:ComF family protein